MTSASRLPTPAAAKRVLRDGVKSAARISGASLRPARRHGGAHIIMIHGVGGEDLPASEAREVLRWLQANVEIVPLDDVVGAIEAGVEPISHRVALTFDDGLRNNLTVAQPILQELGLPATFFICPELIDDGCRLWTQDARFRFGYLQEDQGPSALEPLGRWGYPGSGDPVEWMKRLPIDQRLEVEAWLVPASTGFVPTPQQVAASELLTWDDVRSLDPSLITVGSHTLTHPILPSLTTEAAEHEIVESKARLRSELDREIDYFCYPNGTHRQEHRDLVRGAYRAAVGTTLGTNRSGHDLTDLARVPVQAQVDELAWAVFRASA